MINWKNLYEKLSDMKRIVLSTHENPDGDGLGCAYAMHHIAKKMNIDSKIITATKFSKQYNFLNQDKKIDTGSYKDNFVFPFVVGSAFAFGWTPCIGPVLGSILALSATETTIVSGVILLSFYSLGLAIPFILSGYYMTIFLNSKKGFSKHYSKVKKGGGVILFITGVLILTNSIQVISYYILTTFPFLTKLG